MHVGNWLIVGQRSDHTGRVGDVSGVKRLLLYCIFYGTCLELIPSTHITIHIHVLCGLPNNSIAKI